MTSLEWLKFTIRHVCLLVSFIGATYAGQATAQNQRTDIRPDANRLVGEELDAAYAGITHDGAYNFTNDGEPQRFYKESTQDDGVTVYTENDQSFEGRWFTRNDLLCFAYETDQFQGGCFRVYQVGNCYYYYSSLIPEYSRELDQDYWTARSTFEGEAPSCEPGLS